MYWSLSLQHKFSRKHLSFVPYYEIRCRVFIGGIRIMSDSNSYTASLSGIIDDIDVGRIRHPKQQLRAVNYEVSELASAIQEKGLLQPIIVRTKEDYFEIVAGNRRYEACKNLGWRKITSHVEELDDKEAFEIALMENIQRSTLNPVDEAKAFKAYVSGFGWGGVTDLAAKIGKSVSYVTRRMGLLSLPPDIVSSISDSAMSSSMGEELCSIKDNNTQSELAFLISKRHLSVKKVRQLVNGLENDPNYNSIITFSELKGKRHRQIQKSLDKSIIVLRIAMNRIAMIIDDVRDDCWITAELLLQHRNVLHEQIDILLKEKRKRGGRLDRMLT
jgi:ParB family chromosome partitioning protein